MIVVVEVDVALSRPPRVVDDTHWVLVHTDGDSITEARKIACQVAGAGARLAYGPRLPVRSDGRLPTAPVEMVMGDRLPHEDAVREI